MIIITMSEQFPAPQQSALDVDYKDDTDDTDDDDDYDYYYDYHMKILMTMMIIVRGL